MDSRKWFTFVVLLVAMLCVNVASGSRNCTTYNSTVNLCTYTNGTSASHEGGGGRGHGRGRRWISELIAMTEEEKRLQQQQQQQQQEQNGENVDD